MMPTRRVEWKGRAVEHAELRAYYRHQSDFCLLSLFTSKAINRIQQPVSIRILAQEIIKREEKGVLKLPRPYPFEPPDILGLVISNHA